MDQEKVARLQEDLFSTRLLIFVEDKPQSNQYHQIMLTPDEFKKLSFSLGEIVDSSRNPIGKPIDVVKFNYSKEVYELPDIQQIYE